MRYKKRLTAAGTAALTLTVLTGGGAAADVDTRARIITGALTDGSDYLIEVPSDWNGTLLLYSHGYTSRPDNPAQDVSNEEVGKALLADGYALAGSSFPGPGWQTPAALGSQIATIDQFAEQVGAPRRVIAWGHSMGGEITTLLAERAGDRIDGAVAMCPNTAGVVPWFNSYLDGAFTMRALLDPDGTVPLVGAEDPAAAADYWAALARTAQQTSEGRARLALAASFATLPPWSDLGTDEPGRHDYEAQQINQFHSFVSVFAGFQTLVRADMEAAAGGPFSWNMGVNYRELYADLGSGPKAEVAALYREAGLDLGEDLDALESAPRVAPSDPQAIDAMNAYAPTGEPQVPLLTVHTTGDNLVFPNLETAYADRVRANHEGALLRQTYTAAPGHCNFTTSEQIAAIETMDRRLSAGVWPSTSPAAMTDRAAETGTDTSNYLRYRASDMPRPELRP